MPEKEVVKGDMRFMAGYPRILQGTRWRVAEKKYCLHCGKPFWGQKGREVKFCSARCRNTSKRHFYAKKRVGRRCIVCGRIIYVKPSKADKYKTCGRRECHAQLMRGIAHERQGVNGFGENWRNRPRIKGKFV